MENENTKVLPKLFVNIDHIRRLIFPWYAVTVIDNFSLIHVLNSHSKLLFTSWILKDWIKEYVATILNVSTNLKLVEILKDIYDFPKTNKSLWYSFKYSFNIFSISYLRFQRHKVLVGTIKQIGFWPQLSFGAVSLGIT